jgi:hypothetical protein
MKFKNGNGQRTITDGSLPSLSFIKLCKITLGQETRKDCSLVVHVEAGTQSVGAGRSDAHDEFCYIMSTRRRGINLQVTQGRTLYAGNNTG